MLTAALVLTAMAYAVVALAVYDHLQRRNP
jgi:hypothetical protein